MPLVRAPHECPYRASRDELSGWVYLRFALTPERRPESITVIDADPPGVFDRAALEAVCPTRLERPIEIVLEWKGCNIGLGPRLELEPPGQI